MSLTNPTPPGTRTIGDQGLRPAGEAAQRVVERLANALGQYDARVATCPVRNPRKAYRPFDRCERCGAQARDTCGTDAGASYELVCELRRLVEADAQP